MNRNILIISVIANIAGAVFFTENNHNDFPTIGKRGHNSRPRTPSVMLGIDHNDNMPGRAPANRNYRRYFTNVVQTSPFEQAAVPRNSAVHESDDVTNIMMRALTSSDVTDLPVGDGALALACLGLARVLDDDQSARVAAVDAAAAELDRVLLLELEQLLARERPLQHDDDLRPLQQQQHSTRT